MTIDFTRTRAALVIAHPGHELRVYQWLRLARPLCLVLTDGSGHSGQSRLESTTVLLKKNHARPGSIYGRFEDQAIYEAIIKGETELFINLTAELANEFIEHEIDYVVGDAIEGYNPAHDVCRFMINAAVAIASKRMGRSVTNLEVCLTGQPIHHSENAQTDVWIHLDEDSATEKLEAANQYRAIAFDVERVLSREGMQAVKTERLRPACECATCYDFTETPYYEIHGEKQVAAGYYEQVLRYREHVRPLAVALRDYSMSAPNCSGSVLTIA